MDRGGRKSHRRGTTRDSIADKSVITLCNYAKIVHAYRTIRGSASSFLEVDEADPDAPR